MFCTALLVWVGVFTLCQKWFHVTSSQKPWHPPHLRTSQSPTSTVLEIFCQTFILLDLVNYLSFVLPPIIWTMLVESNWICLVAENEMRRHNPSLVQMSLCCELKWGVCLMGSEDIWIFAEEGIHAQTVDREKVLLSLKQKESFCFDDD